MAKQVLLSANDLMVMFRVSRSTVRRWMQAGLPSKHYGHQILRFEADAAVEWVKENKPYNYLCIMC
jgi:phage terminase Nu1 subunit (DNA packaging protein)